MDSEAGSWGLEGLDRRAVPAKGEPSVGGGERERDAREGRRSPGTFGQILQPLVALPQEGGIGRRRCKACPSRDALLQGNANVFDQILVSKGLIAPAAPLRCVEASASVEAFPAMVSTAPSEGPIRFGLSEGNAEKHVNHDGFSDHFPVSVVLERRQGTERTRDG